MPSHAFRNKIDVDFQASCVKIQDMIYLIGTLGFIGGFIFGQMLLYFMLRHKNKEDLLNDPYIKWTYGTANWLFAGLGAYGFILLYRQYFPTPIPLN